LFQNDITGRTRLGQTRFERSLYHIFRDWKMLPKQIRLSTKLMPQCHCSVMNNGCRKFRLTNC
jgi:hypothetical protein